MRIVHQWNSNQWKKVRRIEFFVEIKTIILFLADDKSLDLSDYREIKVQESLQRVTSNNLPRSFSVILEDDLVEACKPGDNVAI